MAQIKISGTARPVSEVLSRLQGLGRNPRGFLEALGNEMVDNTRNRVERGVTPQGTPFVPLNELYASGKHWPSNGSNTLIGRGGFGSGLMGTLVHSIEGHCLVWGSNKIYANVHQFGAIIRPKTAKALRFQMGGRWFSRKSVTIPARPYLGFNQDDREAVIETLEVFLRRAMRG